MSAADASQLVWLYDALGNQKVAVSELEQLTLDWSFAGTEELTFAISSANEKAAYLQSDQIVRWQDRLYRNVEMNDVRIASGIVTTVRCEALWYDLIGRLKVGNFALLGETPVDGVTALLENTGWNQGTITTDTDIYSAEANDASSLEHLKTWARVTGNELAFNTLTSTVDMVAAVGEVRPISFRYGRNIRGLTRKIKRPASTRLYPFGAGGLTIADPNPSGLEYVENYSWYTDTLGISLAEAQALYRKDQVWVDQRYLTALSLYDAAVARAAVLSLPIVSYTVKVADLSYALSLAEADFVPGDYVTVEDTEFGIDLQTRVVRYQRDLLEPQNNQVELDFLRSGLGDATLTSDQRTIDYGAVAVLVDSNDSDATITSGLTALADITITVSGTTTPIMGATIVGTASGAGTLTAYASLDGTDIGARIDVPFLDGEQVEVSWPTYVSDLAEGTYVLSWRASITSGAGTVSVLAEQGRAWAIVRGAVGVGFASTPNQSIIEEIPTFNPISPTAVETVLVSTVTHGITATAAPEAPVVVNPTGTFSLPFTLDNPVFGKLDGVGVLNVPLAEEWDDV